MHEDPYLVGEAFRAGASAFLLKEAAASELTEAIAKALKGGSYVTPSASEGLTNISLREPKHREHAPEPTPRQREVIQVLAEGRSMKQVADELKITVRTVAGHKYPVMGLLQLKTKPSLCSTPSSTESSVKNVSAALLILPMRQSFPGSIEGVLCLPSRPRRGRGRSVSSII
jgi:DNA-binding NarL/FixJ family response regulator